MSTFQAIQLKTTNNDIMFIDGQLASVSGIEQITQSVNERLNFIYEEWFLDRTKGTDWKGKVLGGFVSAPIAEAHIKQQILQTEGVISIQAFKTVIDPQSRNIMFTQIKLLTEYGSTTLKL